MNRQCEQCKPRAGGCIPVIGDYPTWRCANCGRIINIVENKPKLDKAIYALQCIVAADSIYEARVIADVVLEELEGRR